MYGTVADWITYAALRGRVIDDQPASEQALQRASDYIRTRYVIRFSDEYDGTSPAVIEATQIAAGYELTTPGFWSKTFTGNDAKVLTRVGEIAWTPTKTTMIGVDAFLPVSPAIEALLLPLTIWGMPAVRVV